VAPLRVVISAGDADPTAEIVCLHGKIDKDSKYYIRIGIENAYTQMIDPQETVTVGPQTLVLGVGQWRVRCRAEGANTGTSYEVSVDYDVAARPPPP